jgi:sialate O-acetylesterase
MMVTVVLLLAAPSLAEVKPNILFTDHMVLQQGKDIYVYGTATASEKVEVTFQGKTASSEAGKEGNWKVNLGQFKPGGPFEMAIKGSNTVTVKDILVGEVWVASGQSNMAWSVSGCTNAPQEIAASKNPQIRMFNVAWHQAVKPQPAVLWNSWQVADPAVVPGWTAVGYFFARELQKKINVPIGILNSSLGGTPAEAWTSPDGFDQPAIRHYRKEYDKALADLPAQMQDYFRQVDLWKLQATEALKTGAYVPLMPPEPKFVRDCNYPCVLFNGMINPLVGYRVRGVVWYQGESNAGKAIEYRTLFPALIRDWRSKWGDDISFLWIQLATVGGPNPQPYESNWGLLREAQTMTLKLPKTGQAVTFDVGDGDIHPRNKQDMGARLALIAAAQYGQDVIFSGPLYKEDSLRIEGNKIRLGFTHVCGGLVSQPGPTLIPRAEVPKDTPLVESELKRFEIAGADRKFVWANAKIDPSRASGSNDGANADTVVVWSDKVSKPVAVRYAWADNPAGANLFNKAGLPASPFRTDDWEYRKP